MHRGIKFFAIAVTEDEGRIMIMYCTECKEIVEAAYSCQDNKVYEICPLCYEGGLEETVPCRQCSELKEDNGDKYCEPCEGEVDKEISDAINDIKTRWDSGIGREPIGVRKTMEVKTHWKKLNNPDYLGALCA